MRYKGYSFSKCLFFLAGMLLLIYSLFPIYWIAINSFKLSKEIFSSNPSLLPHKWTLSHYAVVLSGKSVKGGVSFLQYFRNSLIVATFVTLLALFIGIPAAYGISRSITKVIYTMPLVFLMFAMIPPQAYANSLYLIIRKLGLIDTTLGLIVVYLVFILPLSLWLLSQYFKGIPKDFEEAAKIDGCSRLQIIWKIVIPLSIPGIVITAIFSFIYAWNEFFFASIFTSTAHSMTLPIGIVSYQSAHSISWDLISTAATVAIFPIVIIALIFQRYIIKALTAGGLKG